MYQPLLTQKKERRSRPFRCYRPSIPQTLFGSYTTQSCRALAQAQAVQVLVVWFPGKVVFVRICVHHLHRREEETRLTERRSQAREEEAPQREEEARHRERRSQARDEVAT